MAIKGKILLEELFQLIISNLNDIRNKLWDIQKNIEEDVRLAQKKEELEEETRKDSLT